MNGSVGARALARLSDTADLGKRGDLGFATRCTEERQRFSPLPKPVHPEDLLKKFADWGLPAARSESVA